MDTPADLHFTEYDTRVAGYAVIVVDGRILLTWYNGEGRPERAGWSLPGGGIDFAESIEEGVLREVYEETGYRVELGPLLGTHTFTVAKSLVNGRPLKSVRVLYEATIVGGTLGVTEVDGSTDRAEWLDLAALPNDPYADIVTHALALLGRR
ncbi:NUDIX hydrolase [Salana multivorans]